MKRASLVVTKSESLRERAIQMGIDPEKVRTVRNGCDSSVFHLGDRTAARAQLGVDGQAELVLFVGRLEENKGIEELFEAFTSLAIRRPNMRLVYVGDGLGEQQLRSKAKHLGLEDRICLVGSCSSLKVAQWLAAANVLALPSYSEGFPNVVVEALSCGRPVIATAVGGIPELIDETSGILIAPRDWRALAAAIETAMERNWNEHTISKQFRKSWNDVAEELLGIFEIAVRQKSEKWRARAEATPVMSR